ncbi:43kDa postsynaptic protein [Parasponia andersonii]|uniref:RING-type E3 ubiquitin transferase n=1 Tax=Parasponia andersonii TaxID=3476 RepID=A0A2P5C6G1_PARAD|nr:43kDa postsynaptic protein [Parasponia andersonii]
MADNNNNNDQDGIGSLFKDHKLIFLLIAAATASLAVTIYHLIIVCLCNGQAANRRRRFRRQESLRYAPRQRPDTPINRAEVSVAELIPTHKYKKGEGLVGDDVVCAVCLSEFEDGEDLRTLPECLHSFHVACIDMWLFSHSTCPMCRGDATPSPSPRIAWPAVGPDGETRLDLRVLEV